MELLIEAEYGRVSSGKKLDEKHEIHYQSIAPVLVNKKVFDASTVIGLRPTQEDRLALCPSLGDQNVSFCGIFDGTAGSEASEYIQKNIISHILRTELFQHTDWVTPQPTDSPNILSEIAERLSKCMRDAFLSVDTELIQICHQKQLNYASSTGVTALFWRNVLTIAHVGDSRACITKVVDGVLRPEWLTVDHKPNTPAELKRIESCGGSLVWLHGVKPYIRGGDFTSRQALGERPKQLNYSRAFGGKDLKNYGLIAEPDVSHFEIADNDRVLILGSDGLWDVLSPTAAAEIAMEAHSSGRSAADALVDAALEAMPRLNVIDNITAIAVFLNEEL